MTEVLFASGLVVALIMMLAAGLLMVRSRLFPAEVIDVQVNQSIHIGGQRGEKLLEVLHNANIHIPAACGGKGTCGLCRVKVTGAGAGEPQATERGMLSPAERRAHMRLACQTSLRGDCHVEVADEIMSAGGGFDCEVVSTRMLAPLIREIVVSLPDDRSSAFRAGDFMQISVPEYDLDFADLDVPDQFRDAWEIAGWSNMRAASEKPMTRAYSLASRPEDQGVAVFNIRLAVPPAGREEDVPPGVVSSYLFSLKPGDPLTLSGPFGEFHVQPTNKDMIFVGGGVGMAPLRAMIHQELGKGTTRPITYFYGARSVGDLFYVEEFAELAVQHPNFDWTPALSDPAPGDRWTGATGFVHDTLRARMSAHPAPEDCEYYLCGPPLMISAVVTTLQRLGVERSSIYYDDFGA